MMKKIWIGCLIIAFVLSITLTAMAAPAQFDFKGGPHGPKPPQPTPTPAPKGPGPNHGPNNPGPNNGPNHPGPNNPGPNNGPNHPGPNNPGPNNGPNHPGPNNPGPNNGPNHPGPNNPGPNNGPNHPGPNNPGPNYGPNHGPNNGPNHPNHGPIDKWYPHKKNPPVYQAQANAGFILHRTAMILFEAQRIAGQGRYYNGLGQAVAHQQMARDLYWRGNYQDAIFHSLRARNIALQIINWNKGRMSWGYAPNSMEDDYCRMAPQDNDLDLQIRFMQTGNDHDFLFIKLDIDLD